MELNISHSSSGCLISRLTLIQIQASLKFTQVESLEAFCILSVLNMHEQHLHVVTRTRKYLTFWLTEQMEIFYFTCTHFKKCSKNKNKHQFEMKNQKFPVRNCEDILSFLFFLLLFLIRNICLVQQRFLKHSG